MVKYYIIWIKTSWTDSILNNYRTLCYDTHTLYSVHRKQISGNNLLDIDPILWWHWHCIGGDSNRIRIFFNRIYLTSIRIQFFIIPASSLIEKKPVPIFSDCMIQYFHSLSVDFLPSYPIFNPIFVSFLIINLSIYRRPCPNPKIAKLILSYTWLEMQISYH